MIIRSSRLQTTKIALRKHNHNHHKDMLCKLLTLSTADCQQTFFRPGNLSFTDFRFVQEQTFSVVLMFFYCRLNADCLIMNKTSFLNFFSLMKTFNLRRCKGILYLVYTINLLEHEISLIINC